MIGPAAANPVCASSTHPKVMIPIHVDSAWKGTADCRSCAVRDMVLFADLQEDDFKHIHSPIDDLVYSAEAVIFSEGSVAAHLFTLRTGLVKLVRYTEDGRKRIVRVLKPGDVIGLEALAAPKYATEAVAVLDASVCRIPLPVIHQLSVQSPRLHLRLMQKWQKALQDADDWLAELNFGTARQRVWALVLKMRDPDQPSHTTLFSREDMGAMTDLKLETVSREISSMVRAAMIRPLDRIGRRYEILVHTQTPPVSPRT